MGSDFIVFVVLSLVGGTTGWLIGRLLGRFDGRAPSVALGVVLVLSFAGWLGLTILFEGGLRTAVVAWFLCIVTGLVGFSRKRRASGPQPTPSSSP